MSTASVDAALLALAYKSVDADSGAPGLLPLLLLIMVDRLALFTRAPILRVALIGHILREDLLVQQQCLAAL
jgi:hypothetical protein